MKIKYFVLTIILAASVLLSGRSEAQVVDYGLANGVLSFEDTIKIVKLRGEIMQKVCDDIAARSAGNPPGMAAVMGLAPDQVKAIAKEAGEAYAANMNSVKQTVVSGTAEALTKLEELGKAAGARRVMRLAVAGPYHSPLMQAAADELEKVIADVQFNDPKTIFLSNVTGKAVTSGEEIKKNVILQGAPGVGKTFAAKRLAYSMMGQKDQDRVMLVQFHQSYTYEDFIEGFRPTSAGSGFEIKKGSFYNFCKKAGEDLENEYFFIIDEINRGNLSKIFGELFMLIENDKRGNSLQLLYSDEKFNVPSNVYIIGMMNTADRSLAMIDYALRRRFSFYTMDTAFEKESFKRQIKLINNTKIHALINTLTQLNKAIENDANLGKGFKIGHSYFCVKNASDNDLRAIVKYEIIPLLEEYWYDEPSNVEKWSNELLLALN